MLEARSGHLYSRARHIVIEPHTQSFAAPRWLRNLLRFIVLGIATAHTTVAVLRQSMNEDGIDYLDVGAAYWEGEWGSAINGIWSPLYSWIIGAVVHFSEPSVSWEFPVVQITNLFIFCIALICFEFFWRTLTAHYYGTSIGTREAVKFPPSIWMLLGYSLFAWTALNLIEIWSVTPDLCVAALVYLAAGFVMQTSAQTGNKRAPLLLGLVLGLGYLAKAAMLPLAIACLMLMFLLHGSVANRAKQAAKTLVVCMLVAGPFIVALSLTYGELMFTGVSKFTYLKHVNEMQYPDFIPDAERLGSVPEHPPAIVFDDPPVYVFAEPIGGTYPMSYDPSYWTAGVTPKVELMPQLRALATSGMFWFDLFIRKQGGFLAILRLLVVLSVRRPIRVSGMPPDILLTVWAAAAFAMYSLVHLAPRYIAPFVILFWSGILASVQLPKTTISRPVVTTGGVMLAAFIWLNIMAFNAEGVGGIVGFRPAAEAAVTGGQFSDGHSADHVEVANQLIEEGLQRNDRIGFIGYSFSAYWARLARLQIIAEIYPEDIDLFWTASPDRQAEALQAFYSAGATAVIAEPVQIDWSTAGWRELGDTGYLIHREGETGQQ